jgi:hypothetical protein
VVNRLAFHSHADAAVLGQAFLGDIQVGENLQARDQSHLHPLGQGLDHLQHPIDAEPHHQLFLLRLHVDVAGASFYCQRQDGVGHAHHRGVFSRMTELGGAGRRRFFLDLLQVDLLQGVALQYLQHGLGVEFASGDRFPVSTCSLRLRVPIPLGCRRLLHHFLVRSAYKAVEIFLAARHGLDHGAFDDTADVVKGQNVVGVDHRQRQPVVPEGDGQHLVLQDGLFREQRQHTRIELRFAQCQKLDPHVLAGPF